MTASLQATALLAGDPLFGQRVQAAMVTAAVNVATEPVGTQNLADYALRHSLAVAILQGGRVASGGGGSPAGWLSQFVWAVAANVTVAADVGHPVSIVSSSQANPSVIATGTVHGLVTGQWVEITGHLLNTIINGLWAVTMIDITHFSIPVLGAAAGGATGTVQVQPPDADIQFAVNSVFGSIAGVGTGV
jgi:hypothetical protein